VAGPLLKSRHSCIWERHCPCASRQWQGLAGLSSFQFFCAAAIGLQEWQKNDSAYGVRNCARLACRCIAHAAVSREKQRSAIHAVNGISRATLMRGQDKLGW